MRGRYRPYLSLREGSEKDHNGGARGEGERHWCGIPFPSPRMIPDRSSPSRIRYAASRPGPLRADPKGMAVYEGKGEVQITSDRMYVI